MASEIRVNKINSRTGVGTITLSPTGVDFTGIATVATLKATTGIVTTLNATGDVTIGDKIIHDGDTNTAIRFPAADTFTVETGGSERVRVDSSGRMGLGSASPEDPLHIKSNSGSIRLENTVVSNNDSTIAYDNSTFEIKVDPNNVRGSSSLTVDIDDTNALTIDDSRQIGIGTASPSGLLHISKSGGNAKLIIQRSNTASNTNDYGSILWKSSAGNNNALIGVARHSAENDAYMFFSTASGGTLSERVRIHSGGTLSASTGIELGSGLDGTSANTLDDYEEGSFSVSFVSGLTSDSYSNTSGHYTKIGNFVTFTIRIAGAGTNSGSEQVKIGNLPFVASSSTREGGAWFNYRHDLDTGGGPFMHISKGGDDILWYGNAGAAWVGSDGDGLNNNTFHVQGFYYSDS